MNGKRIKEKISSGIDLTNHEIKNIMEVIKTSENRGILLKGNARKVSQKEDFSIFLSH